MNPTPPGGGPMQRGVHPRIHPGSILSKTPSRNPSGGGMWAPSGVLHPSPAHAHPYSHPPGPYYLPDPWPFILWATLPCLPACVLVEELNTHLMHACWPTHACRVSCQRHFRGNQKSNSTTNPGSWCAATMHAGRHTRYLSILFIDSFIHSYIHSMLLPFVIRISTTSLTGLPAEDSNTNRRISLCVTRWEAYSISINLLDRIIHTFIHSFIPCGCCLFDASIGDWVLLAASC